jgi:site-specific recombinase XerD
LEPGWIKTFTDRRLCAVIVVECIDRFLAHPTATERSPNTVRAHAHDLRDFFAFLESRATAWDAVVLEDLGKFRRHHLRTASGARVIGRRPSTSTDEMRRETSDTRIASDN